MLTYVMRYVQVLVTELNDLVIITDYYGMILCKGGEWPELQDALLII